MSRKQHLIQFNMELKTLLNSTRNIIEDKTLLIFWNVLLFFGGTIFLFYFMHIKYFPILELNSIIVLLASGAIVGGIIIFIMCLFLILPSIMSVLIISTSEAFAKIKNENNFNFLRALIVWHTIPCLIVIICTNVFTVNLFYCVEH